MATGEYYSVPEIDHTTATDEVFGSFMKEIRSMDKPAWAGEQLVDLAGRGPEELPPCFLAVEAEALSPRTGWETEHGKWEPKDMYLDRLFRSSLSDPLFRFHPGNSVPLVRTRLVFRPKDGSNSDLAIDMYNTITPINFLLEEDLAICHVFRVSKGKGKGVVYSEAPDDPFDDDFSDNYNLGRDMPSNYYFGGPNKRRRLNAPVGGSRAWDNFTRICTKDPDVVYAACHHCGRLMKLTGGAKCGTKSLLRHDETCPCKPVID